MPDPAFRTVGSELRCRALLLRGRLAPETDSKTFTQHLENGQKLELASHPKAKLRIANLCALYFLRVGAYETAREVAQEALENAKEAVRKSPELRNDAFFRTLDGLSAVQASLASQLTAGFGAATGDDAEATRIDR